MAFDIEKAKTLVTDPTLINAALVIAYCLILRDEIKLNLKDIARLDLPNRLISLGVPKEVIKELMKTNSAKTIEDSRKQEEGG